jgi:hypothetical protein
MLLLAGRQWLMTVILVTQEADIRKTVVQRQSRQTVLKTLSRKYPTQKVWQSDSRGSMPASHA